MWLSWCWRQTDGDILANVEGEGSWTGNNKRFRFTASKLARSSLLEAARCVNGSFNSSFLVTLFTPRWHLGAPIIVATSTHFGPQKRQ